MKNDVNKSEIIQEAVTLLGLAADTEMEGPFRIEPKDAGAPAVDVFPLAAKGEVVLLARIGYVTYGREAVYRVLLQQQYLGQGTGGAVFAVDPSTNEVVLQRAVPVAGSSGEKLAGAIHAFAELSAAAREAAGSW